MQNLGKPLKPLIPVHIFLALAWFVLLTLIKGRRGLGAHFGSPSPVKEEGSASNTVPASMVSVGLHHSSGLEDFSRARAWASETQRKFRGRTPVKGGDAWGVVRTVALLR